MRNPSSRIDGSNRFRPWQGEETTFGRQRSGIGIPTFCDDQLNRSGLLHDLLEDLDSLVVGHVFEIDVIDLQTEWPDFKTRK